MHLLMRFVSALMAGLFIFAAALQYNDPDPVRWAAIYLSAAVASILYIVGRLRWYIPVLICLIALGWAATLVSHVWGQVKLGQLFESWEMANPTIEEGREMYGLLIVAVWMAVLLLASLKKRHPVRVAEEAGDGR